MRFAYITASCLVFGAAVLAKPALAQEAASDPALAVPGIALVDGIADGDELNIRATASPTGMVIARVTNGYRLNNLGCSEVKGSPWCKVEDPDDPTIFGWTPGRYLVDASSPIEPEPVEPE